MRVPIVLLFIVVTRGFAAGVVLGGGLADTDCTVGFEGVAATNGASGVVCTDGDAACDVDTAADGSCRFDVRVCARIAADGCTPRDISSITVTGLALDTPAASGSPRCGAVATLLVPRGSAVGATMLARSGSDLKDVDYLNLCCRTETAPFDAVRCALAVEPSIAGCAQIAPRFVTARAKARTFVEQAAADPAHARKAVKRATRALQHMRVVARRIAKSDACGDALGLLTGYAQDTLRSAHP